MSSNDEWIDIYNPKTGERLCRIKAPQKKPQKLGLLFLNFKTVWKHPIAVERWAWQQAYTNVISLNSVGIAKAGSSIPATFNCRCIVCGQNTIRSATSLWNVTISHLLHRPCNLIGFTCWNLQCDIFQVLIPIALHEHVDEMPSEYLQDRFGLYLKPEEKRLEELIYQYGFTGGTNRFQSELSQRKKL
jgi:hypothetical protein